MTDTLAVLLVLVLVTGAQVREWRQRLQRRSQQLPFKLTGYQRSLVKSLLLAQPRQPSMRVTRSQAGQKATQVTHTTSSRRAKGDLAGLGIVAHTGRERSLAATPLQRLDERPSLQELRSMWTPRYSWASESVTGLDLSVFKPPERPQAGRSAGGDSG